MKTRAGDASAKPGTPMISSKSPEAKRKSMGQILFHNPQKKPTPLTPQSPTSSLQN